MKEFPSYATKKQTHNNFFSANFAIKKSYFLEIKLEINKKESKSNKTVNTTKIKSIKKTALEIELSGYQEAR